VTTALAVAAVVLYAGFLAYLTHRRCFAVGGHFLRSLTAGDAGVFATVWLLTYVCMLCGWWVVLLWNYAVYKYHERRYSSH
jgi:hypothetical protein